jgi:predicted TIM-barrel fold metal-dependent hydrolase
MIIDAHNHPDWHGHDLKKFIANMDKYGIAKSWILSWECPRDEHDPSFGHAFLTNDVYGPISFSRCLSYAEREPDRFILGYAPDPRRPDAVEQLRAGVEIYGVKICGEVKVRMMYDNPDALRLFRYCGEAGLPVVLHIDYEIPKENPHPRPNYWYGGGIEAFERTLTACPDTTFLGHAPGFWAHIANDGAWLSTAYPEGKVEAAGKVQEMLRKYPNLYGDLSAGSGLNALKRDPEHAKLFIEEFQDRLLFARDFFDGRLLEFLNELDLPGEIQEKVFYKNAEKLIHLD